FFQAEDGIRDRNVTGVQTCALPISTIFVVAEWPLARKQHWETLLRARAIENQGYIIASNTYGEIVDQTFAGRSMIIGPFGDVEDEADDRSETVVTGTTDGSEVDRIREEV